VEAEIGAKSKNNEAKRAKNITLWVIHKKVRVSSSMDIYR
jgi:hypothetical protein